MTIDPATAAATAEVAGKAFYFCCKGCQSPFVTTHSSGAPRTCSVPLARRFGPGSDLSPEDREARLTDLPGALERREQWPAALTREP